MLLRFLFLGLLFLGLEGNFAHAQAAAESVLLNGHVGLAGAKAGTAMGNSLSRATSGIAGQIQNVPQSKVVVHRNPRTTPASRSTRASNTPATPTTVAPATGGSMITSIQGGHVTRPATSSTPSQHN
jgi:hypothetical protein